MDGGELKSLQSEILKDKNAVERTFAPHCLSVLLSFKVHLLDHVVKILKWFGSFSSMDAAPFENFVSS